MCCHRQCSLLVAGCLGLGLLLRRTKPRRVFRPCFNHFIQSRSTFRFTLDPKYIRLSKRSPCSDWTVRSFEVSKNGRGYTHLVLILHIAPDTAHFGATPPRTHVEVRCRVGPKNRSQLIGQNCQCGTKMMGVCARVDGQSPKATHPLQQFVSLPQPANMERGFLQTALQQKGPRQATNGKGKRATTP